jgi:hypothetical protein
MPRQLHRNATPFTVGVSEFIIDGLLPNTTGFVLTMGRDPAWDAMVGPIFRLTIDIALDGVTYQPWITSGVDGGPVNDRNGNPLTTYTLGGSWPGEVDTDGSRKALRAVNLRATLNVMQDFTATSVDLYTV